jgi:hypothetical protein
MPGTRARAWCQSTNEQTIKRSNKEKKHEIYAMGLKKNWCIPPFSVLQHIGRKYGPLLECCWDPTGFFLRTPRKSLVREAERGTKRLLTTPRCSAWMGRLVFSGWLGSLDKNLQKGWGHIKTHFMMGSFRICVETIMGNMSYIMWYPPVEQPTRKSNLENPRNYGGPGGSPQIGNCLWL